MGRTGIALVLLSVGCSKAQAVEHADPKPPAPAIASAPVEPAAPTPAPEPAKPKHPESLPNLELQEVAETGSMPKGATLSHDGSEFFVTNFGQPNTRNVTIYDAKTLDLHASIDVAGPIVESALAPDGKTLFISSFSRSSVMYLDLESKKVTHEVKTGTNPKILVASPDGKSVFTANWSMNSVTQVDVASASVVRTLDVGKAPRGMAMTKGGKLFVANFFGESMDIFEGDDLAKRHRIKTCKCPRHLVLSPDEKTLYMSCLNTNQVQAMDVATEAIVHQATVGESPKSVDVSRDGRYLWTADYGTTRSISVVDTASWTSKVLPIAGMDRGSGVAIAPDGEHALVTGWYDGHVYLVGFEGTGGHPEEAKAKMRKWQFRAHHADPGD